MNASTCLDRLPPSTEECPVDLGAGLTGVLRVHGVTRVLYVRNVTDEPRSFLPAGHLGGTGAPTFLGGAVTTAGEAGEGLICLLEPGAFVYLASPDPDAE